MEEKLVAIIEDESRSSPSIKGVTYVRVGSEKAQYDLYFTDKRIVGAVVFSTSDLSALIHVASFEMILKWKKFRKERREQYKGRPLDEIMNMHKDSFEIPYEKIKSIQVKKGVIGAKLHINVIWEGKIEEINLKLPKSRMEEVDTLIHTYLLSKAV